LAFRWSGRSSRCCSPWRSQKRRSGCNRWSRGRSARIPLVYRARRSAPAWAVDPRRERMPGSPWPGFRPRRR
jgi:hypothetical protein